MPEVRLQRYALIAVVDFYRKSFNENGKNDRLCANKDSEWSVLSEVFDFRL